MRVVCSAEEPDRKEIAKALLWHWIIGSTQLRMSFSFFLMHARGKQEN